MQISTMSMVVAAIVEVVRLGEVRRMNLYTSTAPVPMSVFWLVPQYFIIGAAEIMVNIGTLEMFYSEVTHSCMRRDRPSPDMVYAHGHEKYACLSWIVPVARAGAKPASCGIASMLS